MLCGHLAQSFSPDNFSDSKGYRLLLVRRFACWCCCFGVSFGCCGAAGCYFVAQALLCCFECCSGCGAVQGLPIPSKNKASHLNLSLYIYIYYNHAIWSLCWHNCWIGICPFHFDVSALHFKLGNALYEVWFLHWPWGHALEGMIRNI